MSLTQQLATNFDRAVTPATVTLAAYAALAAAVLLRRWWTRPAMVVSIFGAAAIAFGLSLANAEFAGNVLAPDNLAVVGMVFLLGFFLWLALWQAVENDRRAAGGQPLTEAEYAEKSLVWPDLVYIELICAVALTAGLLVWSLAVPAPLEGPAQPSVTANPSKAPWYFVGLQELLGYSDAWWVGVVVPTLCIVGLALIPYLDRSPKRSGHYSFAGRRRAISIFLFGFLGLWIVPILIGTFLRGPNWTTYGPFEPRDPLKASADGGQKLSAVMWSRLLDRAVPEAPAESGTAKRLAYAAWRESVGLAMVAAYLLALPPLLGRTIFRDLRQRLVGWRYAAAVILFVLMLTLPLKMFLRWTFGLSYMVCLPEISLNI